MFTCSFNNEEFHQQKESGSHCLGECSFWAAPVRPVWILSVDPEEEQESEGDNKRRG